MASLKGLLIKLTYFINILRGVSMVITIHLGLLIYFKSYTANIFIYHKV